MKRVKVTPRAKLDLLAIWEYIAADSVEAADRVITTIEAEFQKLAEMPGMGHTKPQINDPSIRIWRVYSYLIAYRPDTSPMQILRVVSGYRDLANIFD